MKKTKPVKKSSKKNISKKTAKKKKTISRKRPTKKKKPVTKTITPKRVTKRPAKKVVKKPIGRKSQAKKKSAGKPTTKHVAKTPLRPTVKKASEKAIINFDNIKSVFKNGVYVKAYQGDHMTLLAFDIDDNLNTSDFVGFTIQYETTGGQKFYISNKLNFTGEDKLTDSSVSPIQKFRWLHVPGNLHQELNGAEIGTYKYSVTPRYFDKTKNALKSLDSNLTSSVSIDVGNFINGIVELGFTRSYVNSQAYKTRFGMDNKIVPDGDWQFDTTNIFETFNNKTYTYEDLYEYLGFTARKKILELLEEVKLDKSVTIEMFTYDFNEPKIAAICLELAKEGRIKIISGDYVTKSKNKTTGEETDAGHGLVDSPETGFYDQFEKISPNNITRGHFGRFQHHKVIVFSKNWLNPYMVLSGSTNFSITGLCVNANHIIIMKDAEIATLYSDVFKASWGTEKMKEFKVGDFAGKAFNFTKGDVALSFTFAPHGSDFATKTLDGITETITNAKQSVLFSVMQMSGSGGSVMPALTKINNNGNIFSYGVTDQVDKDQIALYKPGVKKGILVDAKILQKTLPPPFNTEPTYQAHKIHHKFVVVDFNTPEGKVYFGSSNLALGGEENNGDNLICIQHPKITTVFALEAIRLVDHFDFRAKRMDAIENNKTITLKSDNIWAKSYFDENDLKFMDRHLFA